MHRLQKELELMGSLLDDFKAKLTESRDLMKTLNAGSPVLDMLTVCHVDRNLISLEVSVLNAIYLLHHLKRVMYHIHNPKVVVWRREL